VSQMNPKKKIFETIQPGTGTIFLSRISSFNRSAFPRVHHTRYEGGSMDQPGNQVNSQDPYQGRHLCCSKFRWSVVIVDLKKL